jgi:hypothetical protein
LLADLYINITDMWTQAELRDIRYHGRTVPLLSAVVQPEDLR